MVPAVLIDASSGTRASILSEGRLAGMAAARNSAGKRKKVKKVFLRCILIDGMVEEFGCL